MAVGDAAGAKGLVVYDDTLLYNNIDTALNQRGDDIAKVMTRADALEKAVIKTPKFRVQRSTNGQNLPGSTWTQMTAGAWGTPSKNVGPFGWAGGVLTVPRAGTYMVHGHAHVYSDDYVELGLQITRNTTSVDTGNTVAKGEWTSYSEPGETNNPSIDAVGLLVPLNANDVLRMFVQQRNRGGQAHNTGGNSYDLILEALWMDEL